MPYSGIQPVPQATWRRPFGKTQNTTDTIAVPYGYTVGYLRVEIEGRALNPDEYTADNGMTVQFSQSLPAGTNWAFEIITPFQAADHYTKGQSDDRYFERSIADGRFLKQGETLSEGILPSGTVVQFRSQFSGSHTATGAVQALSDQMYVEPKRNDTELFVSITYSYNLTRNSNATGGTILLRNYTGSSYATIPGAYGLELVTTEKTTTVLRGNGALSGVLTQADRRSDVGTWTIRAFGTCYYDDNNEEFMLYRSTMSVMEIVV